MRTFDITVIEQIFRAPIYQDSILPVQPQNSNVIKYVIGGIVVGFLIYGILTVLEKNAVKEESIYNQK